MMRAARIDFALETNHRRFGRIDGSRASIRGRGFPRSAPVLHRYRCARGGMALHPPQSRVLEDEPKEGVRTD